MLLSRSSTRSGEEANAKNANEETSVLTPSHEDMKDKIIFLDFDGVLNTEHYQNFLYHEGKPWQDEFGAFFDPEAVAQLKRIVDATNADIVVESSWKYLGLEAMQEMWEARNMPGRIIDITPSSVSDSWLLTANLDEIDDAMAHYKGMEIASWLSDNAKQGTKYVILDDEYVIMDSQLSHFVLTNPYDGITEEIANKAISILNS